ncbi:MAG: glycoside hydrolase family 38 C-terminal domain-containing protein [Candidatus Brocadiia bacterium]
MAKEPFTTYLLPGVHSDVVWLEDQRDYAASLMDSLDQHLQVCRFDPAYGLFLHELTYLKPYLDVHPEQRDFVRQLVAEGRAGTAGSHGQPSEGLVSGEGLLRNILYGRLYHERVLGDEPTVYMPWDVFGHTAQLGQLLAKCRFTGCIWSKPIHGAYPVFWHQALDGSMFLFRRVPYGVEPRGAEAALAFFREAYRELASLGFPSDLRLDALDFKPPTAWMAGACERLRGGEPSVLVGGTAHEAWFREARQALGEGEARAPATARDFEWYHQGTALSRVNLKQANRLAENALGAAEAFAAVAAYLGADYPDRALDKAWRQVLFNQHHDAVGGPLCDRAYLDVLLGYREALELAAEARSGALEALAGAVDTHAAPSGSIPLLVFNALNWPRTEPVQATVAFPRPVAGFALADAEGNEVACETNRLVRREGKIAEAEIEFLAADVPPVGYATYAVVAADEPPPPRAKASGFKIENEFFSIAADPQQGGGISRLYDKLARRELVDRAAGPANELVALEEKPNREEPAWELYTLGPKAFSREHAASVSAEAGPVSARLVVQGEMSERRAETSFTRRHEIVLYRGVRRVFFRTWLDHYRGQHHLYAVTFPAKLRGCQPVYETSFGTVVRRPSKGKLDFRTSQGRNYSDCGARRAHNWVELGHSAVLKAGSSRLAIGAVNLVITDQEGLGEQARRLQSALVRKGVPVSPQHHDCEMPRRRDLPHEDACLATPNSFNYDLKFGTAFRIALDVGGRNTYTATLLGRLHPRIRSEFEETLKRDRHAVLFLYDEQMPDGWPPLPVLLVSAQSEAALAACLDGLLARFEKTATIEIDPRADVSGERHILDDYGLAVLNRGNVLASVESDNTLVLFLMHTAAWGASPWGPDRLPFFLVPEHKSHLFHYALYPHRGDWREAKTYRAGQEYNSPLLPLQTTRHRGSLPPAHSFLRLDGESLVLSALRPASQPTAAFEARGVDPVRDGLLVRWYEAEGKPQKGSLAFWQPLKAARRANLLGEPAEDAELAYDDTVEVASGGFGVDSMILLPRPLEKSLASGPLAREAEPEPAVHFRHWEHNAGAAPLGYSPVAISLHGQPRTRLRIAQGGVTINTLRLAIANNTTDRAVKGKATLHVAPGWHTVPAEVAYDLEPGAHQTTPILLAFDDARRHGLVKARIEHRGQVVQDCLRVGQPPWLDASIHRRGDELDVHLRNPSPDPIEGTVALVTPLEAWPRACVGAYCLGEVAPRQHAFQVEPGEEVTCTFGIRVRDPEAYSRYDSIWAVVKIAANGLVDYLPVPGTSIAAETD